MGKTKKILAEFLLPTLIFIFFLFLYLSNHTYGALGDDSPGYIFIATRYLQKESPVYVDELISNLLKKFTPAQASFALPHYTYRLVSLEGKIAPKTSLGFPALMALFGFTFGEEGIYYLNPICGALLLLGLYFLILELFRKEKNKKTIAIGAVFLLGLSSRFWNYAVMEPLRDVPAATFLIWLIVFFAKGLRKKSLSLIALAGFLFAIAINVRETSVVAIPTLAILALSCFDFNKRENKKWIITAGILFLITTFLGWSFSLYNNFISKNEINSQTGQLLASNIDHVKSLRIKNMFDNRGRFRPGQGGLKIYFDLVKNYFYIPSQLFFIIMALIYLFSKKQKLGLFFLVWIFSFYLFFAMWVNPYHRYIFPIFPALASLLAYGLSLAFNFCRKELSLGKTIKTATTIAAFFLITLYFSPAFERFYSLIIRQGVKPTARSVLKEDYLKIKQFNLTENNPIVIFLGDSAAYAAYVEAHSGIRSVRAPVENEVKDIINYLLKLNYNVYLWNDYSDLSYLETIGNDFALNNTKIFNFSFGQIELIKVNNPYETKS